MEHVKVTQWSIHEQSFGTKCEHWQHRKDHSLQQKVDHYALRVEGHPDKMNSTRSASHVNHSQEHLECEATRSKERLHKCKFTWGNLSLSWVNKLTEISRTCSSLCDKFFMRKQAWTERVDSLTSAACPVSDARSSCGKLHEPWHFGNKSPNEITEYIKTNLKEKTDRSDNLLKTDKSRVHDVNIMCHKNVPRTLSHINC